MENNIEWSKLGFGYMPTDYNVRRYYHNGKWGEMEITSATTINLHMAAECLHYGQEAFEGLQAFRCPDGKVRVFRMEENAARLQFTCRGLVMPELPTDQFCEMVKKVSNLTNASSRLMGVAQPFTFAHSLSASHLRLV